MDITSLKQLKCSRVLNNSPEISLGLLCRPQFENHSCATLRGLTWLKMSLMLPKRTFSASIAFILKIQIDWLPYMGKNKVQLFKCFYGHVCVLLACVCHFNMYCVFLVSRWQKKSVVVPPSCGGSCKWVPVVVVVAAALLCQWCSSERLE